MSYLPDASLVSLTEINIEATIRRKLPSIVNQKRISYCKTVARELSKQITFLYNQPNDELEDRYISVHADRYDDPNHKLLATIRTKTNIHLGFNVTNHEIQHVKEECNSTYEFEKYLNRKIRDDSYQYIRDNLTQIRASTKEDINDTINTIEYDSCRNEFIQHHSGYFVNINENYYDDNDTSIEFILEYGYLNIRHEELKSLGIDMIIPRDGSQLIVDTPSATHETHIDEGMYTINSKPIQKLAIEDQLIEIEEQTNPSTWAFIQPQVGKATEDHTARIIHTTDTEEHEHSNSVKYIDYYRGDKQILLVKCTHNHPHTPAERTWVIRQTSPQDKPKIKSVETGKYNSAKKADKATD